MYKLFFSKGACSLAVHVALNEIGAKFDLINAKNEDGSKSEAILKVNPRGAVPVLQIDDVILREGVAILTYLLDNHENNLLPKEGLKRAKAMEWFCFANSTLHPAYGRIFLYNRLLGENAAKNELYAPCLKIIQNYWNEIEEHLKTNKFLCGDDLTIADILVTVIANWTPIFGNQITFGDKTKAYFSKVIALPSFAKALATEGVTYKVNK